MVENQDVGRALREPALVASLPEPASGLRPAGDDPARGSEGPKHPPKSIKPRGRKRLHPQWRDHLVYGEANMQPAPAVLADALGISPDEAMVGLRALSKAGYSIAPRVPTNSMLAGYCRAYGSPPQKVESVMVQIGKARKRWRAMIEAGMRVAMSRRARTGIGEA